MLVQEESVLQAAYVQGECKLGTDALISLCWTAYGLLHLPQFFCTSRGNMERGIGCPHKGIKASLWLKCSHRVKRRGATPLQFGHWAGCMGADPISQTSNFGLDGRMTPPVHKIDWGLVKASVVKMATLRMP
mmetsp:Transcript_23809/g.42892  ORF Transcript_23809/g.42892 Transcript_23809/m.42892 type:complete len:132 (-) Transcript_23809:976-1371(-)